MRRVFAVIVLVGLLAGAGWAWWAFAWPSGPRSETFVEIPSGTSTREIAAQLHRYGIISSPGAFEALHLLGGTLKAGEYRFAHPATVAAVYRRIARGDVFTVAVTIPEGANIFDIASRLEAAGLGPHANFLAAAKANTALVAKIDPRATSLEGYLFPSTYRFGRHTAPAEVLRTMVRQFAIEAAALDLTGDVHRTVTLASLVERETPIAAERPLVASVFENRLAKGMPLETDPTVIYAALLRGQYRGSIYQSDLQFDSPFNTYRHAGLPPGPICNPGTVSLRAAMHPAHTDYLYFVAAGADPLGQSRFAATLEQHERNVAAYRAAVRAGAQQR